MTFQKCHLVEMTLNINDTQYQCHCRNETQFKQHSEEMTLSRNDIK